MKTLTLSIALLGALTAGCASTSGADAGSDRAAGSEASATPLAAPPRDDMQALMDAWAKLAEPGPHHAALEPLVGTFDVRMKMRMAPDAPWMESTGTSKQSWILGGRFLKQEFEASGGMGPFEGLGLLGYDNAAERYVNVWVDSWGTQIMPVGEGTMKGDVLAMRQGYDDPITGERQVMTTALKITSPKQHTFTMTAPSPTGDGVYQNLVIEYRRR